MENFEINDRVRIVDKDYIKMNSLEGCKDGTVESIDTHLAFYAKGHGVVKLDSGRSFVVYPAQCKLIRRITKGADLDTQLGDINFLASLTNKIRADYEQGAPIDLVNHPPHYTFGKFEVLDVLMDWFPDAPLLWQVVKYVARAKHKGHLLEDLKKARFYLGKAIAGFEEEQKNAPK